MNIERIKEMLKNKKVIVASSVISLVVIGAIAGIVVHNKNEVEDNKHIVETNKENDNMEEKEAKNKLEELKKIDITKLPEEDKKALESKIAAIEKLIENKEYAKATTDIESLKKDVNTKMEEIDKKEEVKEETESKKENTEVASNTTDTNSTSSNTSSNTSNTGSSSSSSNGSSSSSNQGTVQKPTTPPAVEEKPAQPKPEPTPQPPVVEESKPVYPSVAEVKQRLVSYGQSIGLIYDESLVSNGFELQGTDQMWGADNGGSADRWLVDGVKSQGYTRFAVVVQDLGNGFCSMGVYVSYDE